MVPFHEIKALFKQSQVKGEAVVLTFECLKTDDVMGVLGVTGEDVVLGVTPTQAHIDLTGGAAVMPSVSFMVPEVRGQGRPRACVRAGHASVYKADADRAFEASLRRAFEAARRLAGLPEEPAGGEVSVAVRCSSPKARGPRGSEQPFVQRPDADNVAKSVLDALNGVAWRDDSQVTDLWVRKMRRRADSGRRTEVEVSWGEVDADGRDD